ncbi:hypothetical protein LTS18_015097, partial [Coniosporium uncinatum]
DIDHSGGKAGGDEGTVRGILGLTVDVTAINEQAKLEVDNARLQTEQQIATAANRQKSVFLANMSHEIRTPIAGVIGLTDHLLSTTLDHEQRDLVDSIKLTSNALLTIVSDILDFSKVESGRLDIYEKPMDVKAAVTDMCKIFDMTARQKGLKFKCECTPSSRITVMGDDGRIRQIVSNLLTNAIKFTSKGSVHLCVTTKEAGDITMVLFKVTDTGIGISEQARKNLFQPYQQGDASTARIYGGTGLGLAICRNLVDLMHGKIYLESTVGVGTSFTVNLPLKTVKNTLAFEPPPLMTPQAIIARKASVSSRSGINVLLVEDNPTISKVTMKTIAKLGFSAKAVWNGQEALDYLAAAAMPDAKIPMPDVVLMDVQMPLLDGYAATENLRTKKPYTNIE